jgi:BTB/POZ domain
MASPAIVRFNVGGREFATSMSTLGDENNMLATMARRHADGSLPSADIGGALFIDRDPDCFGAVLNFLRTGKLHVPPGVSRGQLRDEMEFYGLGSDGRSSSDGELAGELDRVVRAHLGEKIEASFVMSGRCFIGSFQASLSPGEDFYSSQDPRTNATNFWCSPTLEPRLRRVNYKDLVHVCTALNNAGRSEGVEFKIKSSFSEGFTVCIMRVAQ